MIRNWHWRNEEGRGRITLTWYLNCDSHRMGIIRVHKDKNIVPGYFEAVGTVLVEEGEYELLGFMPILVEIHRYRNLKRFTRN